MAGPSPTETATLGGGCFWCLEAAYQQIEGVKHVTSGYSAGAEVVQITFNPATISYADILEIFWAIHDPTTRNRQNHDVGPQYRSIIFYATEAQRQTAQASRDEVQKLWPNPLVTEIVPLEKFDQAEAYHQNFFQNHPELAYCQIVINPKLAKLRQKFHSRLKHD